VQQDIGNGSNNAGSSKNRGIIMMTPSILPGLTIFIGVVGAILGGMISKQRTPKLVPVKARRPGRRLH
jgi:hypothetical protein